VAGFDRNWAAALSMLVAFTGQLEASPPQQWLDLKVLILAVGDEADDPGLAYMAGLLKSMGVPFDVVDASRHTLTTNDLYRAPDHGRYNGIILTDAQLYVTHAGAEQYRGGFGADEWQMLYDYERSFRVKESVLAVFPAPIRRWALTTAWQTSPAVTVSAVFGRCRRAAPKSTST